MRITETRLNQLIRELPNDQYQKLRQQLSLSARSSNGADKLNKVVSVFRSRRINSKNEVLHLVGCTDGTYRSYKTRLSEAVIKVMTDSSPNGINAWLQQIQKAWTLCQIGEHRMAYDLAEQVLDDSLKHERGAVARLALELMSTTAQEAYPDEAIAKLKTVGNQMFGIAGKFFSMTDLYDLYLTLGSKSAQTILLRTPQEEAEWRGANHRLSHHKNIKESPLSHWAYYALSKCHIHELKGELEEAFKWYDRLWQRLTGGQKVIDLGDKRFLATFQSYILLAIKTRNVEKAKAANSLFREVVLQHHAMESQQLAFQECFALKIEALEHGVAGIETALMELIQKMRLAKKGTGHYHADWSPHIRYELYLALFKLSFELRDFDCCMMLLKWGNDRNSMTQTASDFTQIIPLLSVIVMFERCRQNGTIDFANVEDTVAHNPKQVYDRFRRKRERFPVEAQIGMFLYKLGKANHQSFPKVKAATLEAFSELKKDTFYYPNLMQYFNFEEWIEQVQ